MSDELNPYPGNLKRHETDKKPSPRVVDTSAYQDPLSIKLLSDFNQSLQDRFEERVAHACAKKDELIQMAVDMAHSRAYEWTDPEFRAVLMDTELAFLAAAEAVGFKPSSR
jgi:hypothetical protein